MRKIITTSLLAAAAVCVPSVGLAFDTTIASSYLVAYETEEECEAALATARRGLQDLNRYKPRFRGQASADFNARYECVEDLDGSFVLVDTFA